jgi:methylglutaconyl-CoA hydratase
MTPASILEVTTSGGVATLWLNRPEVRNAFDERLIAALADAMHTLASDEAVRVVVIAGRGTAFCAGADLNWMARMAGFSPAENCADAEKLARMLQVIYEFPKPAIARIQGDCFAGGIGLVAACDLAVAVTGARFCFSEVRIGLIPATIAPHAIRAMGPRAAARYMLSGERFDAAAAERMGLVHAVVDAARLDEEVATLVAALMAGGPHALAQTKRLIREVADRTLDDALIRDTAARIAAARASEEGREGVAAMLGKRKPRWTAGGE